MWIFSTSSLLAKDDIVKYCKLSASLEDTSPFNDSNHENNRDGSKVLIGPESWDTEN